MDKLRMHKYSVYAGCYKLDQPYDGQMPLLLWASTLRWSLHLITIKMMLVTSQLIKKNFYKGRRKRGQYRYFLTHSLDKGNYKGNVLIVE